VKLDAKISDEKKLGLRLTGDSRSKSHCWQSCKDIGSDTTASCACSDRAI